MGQDSHYLTKWLSFIQSYVEDGFDNLLDKIGLFFLDFQALTKILEWYISTEKKDYLSIEELPEVCPQFHIFYHKKISHFQYQTYLFTFFYVVAIQKKKMQPGLISFQIVATKEIQ